MVNDVINPVMEKLEKFLQTKTVIGEPIEVGNVTLIPIISVSFGYGGGGGDSKGEENGSGAGAGGRVTPKAILMLKNDEVTILPLSDQSSLEKIVAMVPDIVKKIEDKVEKDKEE
ncbi:GerW family sporulation protein [Evansella tamaricis]|uniref:Sporulation protein n=1 Tax=Evansella tamaricis TaxID=2069301 RepID=A0ABS6JMK8_9BACI|nr:spore germination protein GerW family protein [Evansella tamaricis]MBU9714919.1 sporulation protein [Evansella tamaricis]